MKNEILWIVVLLMNTFSMLDIWMVLWLLFGCDMKVTMRCLLTAGGVFFVFNGVLSIFTEGRDMLSFVIMCGYNVLVTLILTKKHYIKNVLLSVPAALVYLQFTQIIVLIDKMTTLDRFYVMYEEKKLTVLYMLSDMIIFFILFRLSKTKFAKANVMRLALGEGILLSVYCVFSPAIVAGLEWFEGQANSTLYKATWILFVLVLDVAVVYAIAHRRKASYYEKLSEDYKSEFESEYSRFQDYKKQQADTVQFRHDWNNHMLLLRKMLDSGKYDEAENYFKELSASAPQAVYQAVTGNEMVDMIISTKMGSINELGIDFRIKGDMAEFHFMKPVDCCIVLSNLLDNAIEAVTQLEKERYIFVEAKKTATMLYLEIKNPVAGADDRKKTSFRNRKKETEHHGIGLQNVSATVKKYGGNYHINAGGKEYVVQMVFPFSNVAKA